MKRMLILSALAGFVAAAGSGCLGLKPAPDPTRFYVLSVEPATDGARASLPSRPAQPIHLAPVDVPAYLENPGVAIRRGDNRVEYSPTHHWAEPLRDGVERCLRDTLSRLIGNESILETGRRRPAGDFLEVQISLSRFEITEGGRAVLSARWRVVQGRGGNVQHSDATDVSRSFTASAQGLEPAVAALSGAIADLGRAIAAELEQRPQTTKE